MGYSFIDFDAGAAERAAAECFAAARGLHAVASSVRETSVALRAAWEGRAYLVFVVRAGACATELERVSKDLHAAGDAWRDAMAEADKEEDKRCREHEEAEERERQEREAGEREQVPVD